MCERLTSFLRFSAASAFVFASLAAPAQQRTPAPSAYKDAIPKASANARLFAAIDHENLNELHAALSQGASLHAQDTYGKTPMVAAAAQGNASLIRALLDAGAEVNELDRNGNSPLTQAAFDNQIDVARVLIAHHADLNYQDRGFGDAAIDFAINRRNLEMIDLLIDSGANLNQLTQRTGFSTLAQAYIDNDDFDLIEHLRHAGAHFASPTEELFAMAARNQLDNIRAAIKAGADVNASNRYGETPLSVAARKGNTEAVRLLIAGGADVNHTGSDQHTALEWAFFSNHRSTVDVLLNAGADPRIPLQGRRSPLSLAAWNFDDPALLLRLLNAGLDVNARDLSQATPIFSAAQAGHIKAARFLLDHGADPTFRDRSGKSPADWARQNKHSDVADLLDRAAAQFTAATH